ncbi:PAAR domain-containing protein [Cronobacter sakazakii]|uniref:PAAR domain-containing protein n=1 Tax=Cronobacter sakazakii TaxID=28141 RepID=UPI0021B54942|nr:PAAR domain-containing protein [Cronobacter sakazakii]UXD96605.1 PAAR domain-containing protein [Cronobacter sakazakii]
MRTGDAISHGGAISNGSGNVSINGAPAAMQGASSASCSIHGASAVSSGSGSVFINNNPAARTGDATGCGAAISSGSGDVFIG